MATNHIITATFKAGRRKTTTRPFAQYDYGQILQFEGFDLPDHYEVQFSNYPNGAATVPQVGDEDGVPIPYSLLATGLPVYAHLFLHDGETDGETIYTVIIPVEKRPYPANGTPTSAEESALTQAITALQAIEPRVDDIEDDIDDIQDDVSTLQDDVSTLQGEVANKVDKVEGKGLSTEDYTSAEKTKLSGIASGAEVNQFAWSVVRISPAPDEGDAKIYAAGKQDELILMPGDGIEMSAYNDYNWLSINVKPWDDITAQCTIDEALTNVKVIHKKIDSTHGMIIVSGYADESPSAAFCIVPDSIIGMSSGKLCLGYADGYYRRSNSTGVQSFAMYTNTSDVTVISTTGLVSGRYFASGAITYTIMNQ